MQRFRDNPFPFAEAILEAHRHRASSDPSHAKKLERMSECFSNWYAETLESFRSPNSSFNAHRQCKIKTCVPCWERRTEDIVEDVMDVYAAAQIEMPNYAPVFLTFTGPCYPMNEITDCIDDAIAHWARFAASKYGQHLFAGYVRGIAICTNHGTDNVKAIVRAVVLTKQIGLAANFGGWLTIWNRYAKENDWTQIKIETPEPSAETLIDALRDFAEQLGALGASPESLCEQEGAYVVCDPDKLKALEEAATNRRFICFGGTMSI